MNTPASKRTGEKALRSVAASLGYESPDAVPWETLRRGDALDLRDELVSQELSPATQSLYLSVFRGVMHEVWVAGRISGDEFQHIREVKAAKGKRQPRGRAVAEDEMDCFTQHLERDRTPIGIRDAALVNVLYSTGMRRSEVVDLRIGDLVPEEKAVLIRGKGNRERTGYMDDVAWDALNHWIDEVRGERDGPLFLPMARGGHIQWRRMSDQAVAKVVRERSMEAAMPPTLPHDMRRSFATQLLDNGTDLLTVQRLMGHSSVTTTQIYDRRSDAASRAAVDGLRRKRGKDA
ncbi:tyrosine-type recombinase/integrase [Thioalkalivibrio sp. K90mix]|uniref:tyrosine-type recombinase/integrase n=1 Tax=Thioalkalivibrio sp. (strain K90mix) TaxID=396595 RepID=UPI0002DEF0FF|nr:tyrosine-type recombinase/integrase [Thioalkalivibrio sp. K90mix]